MALSHVFSSPVADFTGTVTVFDSLGATATTNATALVRPSNWNSVHNEFLTLSGNTAGASTMSGTNLVLQGGNNITLSANGATLVMSGAAQTVQTQNMVSLQGSTGAIVFSNSNGITFGGNASTITASHNGLTTARASNDAIGLNTAQSNVTWTVNSSGLSLDARGYAGTGTTFNGANLSGSMTVNSNGVQLSLSAGAGGAGDGGIFISAAGSSQSAGNIIFSNSNGISFGMNGSTITATVTPGAAAGIAAGAAGTQTATSGTLNFVDSNGITWGMSGSSQITASYSQSTHSHATAAYSGSNGSFTANTVTFGALNGLTFYTSNGSMVGSHNALTTARASNDAVGLNTAQTNVTWTVNSSGISFDAGNYGGTTTAITGRAAITLNSLGLRFDGSGLAGTGFTSTTTAGTAIVATNSTNGLSLAFPTIVTNAITTARASTDAIGLNTAQSNVTWTVNSSGLSLDARGYAGTGTTFNGTNISGSMTLNSAGLRLDLSGGAGGGGVNTATYYATGNTTQSSSGTIALSSMIVRGSNGVSAGISNGSIIVDGPSLTSLSVTGALSASSNGSTISLGVGTVTVTAASNTTQASSGTVNLNGLIFQGAGAASVGVSNGSIVISAPNAGAGNVTFSAGANSAGLASIVFSNSNGVSFGLNGSTITASAAGGGAGNFNLLGANTAGNTTATGNTIGMSGLNVTLSGTNNSQIVISAPATSSLVGVSPISVSTNGSTISVIYNPPQQSFFMAMPANASTFVSQVGNGTIAVYPVIREGDFTASRADILASVSVSSSSNSSHAGVLSVYAALYTRNGSTLSLASSGSQSYQWSNTSNNSLGSIASLRQFSIPINVNYTDGKDLWVAVMSRSSTTNANWFTASNILQSSGFHSGQVVGLIGEASNATRSPLGFGRFSASSSVMPGSMAFSAITGGQGGTASASRLMPNIYFMNFTA